ncbi:Protein of unknown function (DUF620) [Quillaja saponaria]|uniref:Uncharacterized protein n=1 Tax=Quillaja saponaria TaxID=32244 RepID=A0AAD7LKK0_QUISA|nr:Protein of unknown function (DUF620) [Quillaja saponaria]
MASKQCLKSQSQKRFYPKRTPLQPEHGKSLKSWMKYNSTESRSSPPSLTSVKAIIRSRDAEIQLLLGVIGAPLVPFPILSNKQSYSINHNIKDQNIVSHN